MVKKDLVSYISLETGFSKASSEKIVNLLFEGIIQSLRKGEDASFVGFGRFYTHRRNARQGRNPRTGKAILIHPTMTTKFKPGNRLKKL